VEFNIKLTEIFKLQFCAIYENFIHIFPNFRKISVVHIPQPTCSYKQTHTHTHTHTHTNNRNTIPVCEGIYLVFHVQFSCLPTNLLSVARKFPHKTIEVVSLQQHDMLYCSMYAIY